MGLFRIPLLDWPPVPGWEQTLLHSGALRLQGVPCVPGNGPLLALGACLGSASTRSVTRRAGLAEGAGVQRVQDLGVALSDQFGKPLLSSHHAAFPLHTDEAFLAVPARWVLLHCWQSDPQNGGASLLADRDQAWEAADPELRRAWLHTTLPYPCGDVPTIKAAAGRLLRFNRSECEGAAARRGTPLTGAQQRDLDLSADLFAAVAERLELADGDLLVLDNHRMLHGREAFTPGSPRLLKRLRIASGVCCNVALPLHGIHR